MRATEFLNYINKKRKPSKDETDEYTHFTCNEYYYVMKKGKKVLKLNKQSQKYEDIRKQISKNTKETKWKNTYKSF